MTRWILAGALLAAGAFAVPPAWRHWQVVAAADDPVLLSQRRLQDALPAERLTVWLSQTAPREPSVRIEPAMWLVFGACAAPK